MTGIAPSIKVGDLFTTNEGYRVKAIYYKNFDNVTVEFQDENKHVAIVNAANLKKGRVKNPYRKTICGVGFYGVGDFKAFDGVGNTAEYDAWRSMMKRCYDERTLERNPAYKGCTVCDEWHNFQNFAKWYTSQERYNKGYALDKDLLIDGNKVYSPNTCCLVPQAINSLLTDSAATRGKYPAGVYYIAKSNRFRAGISIDNKKVNIGRFDTAEQASQAYQVAKKANIKRMALEWQNRIDERLFNALMAKAA